VQLVHIGAGVDVIGMGLDQLPPNLVAETIEALPRHDFNKAFFKSSSTRSPRRRRARP